MSGEPPQDDASRAARGLPPKPTEAPTVSSGIDRAADPVHDFTEDFGTVELGSASASGVPSLPVVDPSHYEVAGEFARGGMGRILRAEDRRLRRPVALKELYVRLPTAEGRFVREAFVTARLQHPSIVPIYEAGRWPDGVPFYAMKLVSGRSLDLVLREGATLADRIALLPHLIDVAEAVAYAHSEGVVHRDLKPSNVLIGAFGETIVVDWGLAKDLRRPDLDPQGAPGSDGGPTGLERTVVGSVMGTPHYMPPEQARGEGVDERADVYALGAILYYLLAGAPPHSGSTAAEILASVILRAPVPIEARQPEVPGELGAIVRKAMAPDAAQRYPTARELAADLKRFQAGQLVSVHRYSAMELARRWLRRHRAAVSVGAVLTLALLGSLVAGVVGIRRERDRARLEATKAEQINTFVQSMLGSVDPRVQGREVSVASVLDQAAKRLETELQDQPEVQAAVRTTLGTTYQGLGVFDTAEAQLRAALETRRRSLGPRHPDVAKSLHHVAAVVSAKGDSKAAVEIFREALAMYEQLGLSQTLDAVTTTGELASALQSLGDLASAERLHREVLAMQRKLLGNENDAVAASLNNLGVVLGQKGDWAAAEPLHRECLALMLKLRGPEHPEVANAMNGLASVLEARGSFGEAEELFRRSLEMRRKLLGNEHPEVAWTLYNYAFLLRRKGDPQAAIRLSRELLALRGRTLTDVHPLVSSALQVLGSSLQDQGDLRGAERALRESLELRRRTLPAGHWLLATGMSALGECLTRLGRFEEAERQLVGGYEALLVSKGDQHERTLETRARLSSLYEAWRKPEKAAQYRSQVAPPDHPPR